MTFDFESLRAHLERTGRLKLLPRVLAELKVREARVRVKAGRVETAHENPSLLSGARTIENGMLTDTTAKRALLEIYQKITS